MTSRVLALCLAVVLAVQPVGLAAQSNGDFEGASKWRRWALAAGGAVLLGSVATFTDQAGEQARTGVCDTTGCVVAVGSLLGAGLGYLLGSELDRKADRRAREGPTIETPLSAADLPEGATAMVGSAEGVFALARQEVTWVDDAMQARTLVSGLQARAGTVTMGGDLLLLSTSLSLAGVPIPNPTAEAIEISDVGAAALASLDGEHVAVGEPGRIRRMEVTGSSLAPTLLERQTVAARGVPAAMALGLGGNTLWTLEDSSLVSRNATTLAETGRVDLPGRAVAVTFAGPTGVVAMGNEGAVLVDVSNPARPVVGARLRGMEFAYDGAVLDGRAYVSGGAQGLFVYELRGEEPVRVGVIRAPDFAGDLLVRDGHLYILDRAAGKMYRM